MTEQELLLDYLRRLNRRNIAYMLTGSMASNAWGIPRTTHDLDFVVQLPPSQIAGFAEAFRSEDYFVDEAMIRSAYQPPNQFNVLHAPVNRGPSTLELEIRSGGKPPGLPWSRGFQPGG